MSKDYNTVAAEMGQRLMHTFDDITNHDAAECDLMRDNANINADTAMGAMLKYGSEGAKAYYLSRILNPAHAEAHVNGDIHIHDLDFYTLTTTCTQIDIKKLFKDGFSTGHGFLREPNDISSYSALACIAIQSNQNDQHGGQAIVNFDYGMADGVAKSFKRYYLRSLAREISRLLYVDNREEELKNICKTVENETGTCPRLESPHPYVDNELPYLENLFGADALGPGLREAQARAFQYAVQDTDRATYQAMEAFIHNLNTMHSRAGAQVPFSSINYGMDTSPEGRMVVRNLLRATEAGLGNGETPIFPIQIFRVKEGVNYNPSDPNYDLFKLAIRCSAKRLFPNFAFIDAPFNLQYYDPARPETEIAYMGCRTRVIANVSDKDREQCNGRGNLSFTSINLPRIALKHRNDIDGFFKELDEKITLCISQLLHRFAIQCHKKVYNYPFLMGQGVWLDSEKLKWTDEVGPVLKHGTLSVGFIGLAETLVALTGKHHGESQASQLLGTSIVGHMRARLDEEANRTGLNFSLLATPAEGLSGRFLRMDKEKFGVIPGITDREYYTNSFHVPVYYNISAFDKIKTEAPYHALTNAGHISYIEMDGNPLNNLEAFEKVVRCMKESGIGYGSINHPVDRDPVCGYTGIIGDECPGCGRSEKDGEGKFERIRRITGYLVGTMDRWNDAKTAEEHDRTKHSTVKEEI
jgi:ribonucleoside-triphosphate reductase